MTKSGLSRREIALVAGSLLLPIPLLATTGLSLPLPGLVERAVASLLPATVSATEPGATAVAPGSQAPLTGSATPGSPLSTLRIPFRGPADGAASGLARTTVGGSIGVDAPGTGERPPDGGTPSGGDPVPGADPEIIPALPPLTPATPPPPEVVAAAPEDLPDEVVPGDELPVDVSVSENGAGIGSDSGASVDVTTDNGPGVAVGSPPLPPAPPVSVP